MTHDILEKVAENLQRPESSMSIFGKYVGSKLDEFDPKTSRVARRLINEILDAAEGGELSSNASLNFNNVTFKPSNIVQNVPNQVTSPQVMIQSQQYSNYNDAPQIQGSTFISEPPLTSNSENGPQDLGSYFADFTPL